MKISEIFCSLSGESKYSGYRSVFIRTHSCPLRCSYCDSNYAVEGTDFKIMSVKDIVDEVKQYKCSRVVFTGGEPLIQQDAYELINALTAIDINVEVETCGAVDISRLVDSRSIDVVDDPCSITVTMDWKCPASNMLDKMLESNLGLLRRTDVIKFVVSDYKDLEEMKRVLPLTKAEAFVSPVFGKIELKEIADYILYNNLNNVRLQVQLHKLCWDPNARGV